MSNKMKESANSQKERRKGIQRYGNIIETGSEVDKMLRFKKISNELINLIVELTSITLSFYLYKRYYHNNKDQKYRKTKKSINNHPLHRPKVTLSKIKDKIVI